MYFQNERKERIGQIFEKTVFENLLKTMEEINHRTEDILLISSIKIWKKIKYKIIKYYKVNHDYEMQRDTVRDNGKNSKQRKIIWLLKEE